MSPNLEIMKLHNIEMVALEIIYSLNIPQMKR